MRCRAGTINAPTPSHRRLLPRANSCRALCPNLTASTLGNRTSDPDTLSILTLLAFHHSLFALSIHLSSPHPPSPILATFLSMACVLKRFSLTSPRKLSLACVKLGFLRTARTHLTSQLSPCAPLCRSAMSMRCRAGTINAPTPSHRRLLPLANYCRALCPNHTAPTLRNRTSDPDTLSILTLLAFHRFPSLSRRTSHLFVVSTPALSDSNHVSFHDVRVKMFSTHVTT